MKRGLDVVHTGPLAIVQDLGRPGHAALGVGVSGAADPDSLFLADRALGNPADAAAIEIVRCRGVLAAVTGAPAPLQVDGRPEAPHSVFSIPDGAELRLGAPLKPGDLLPVGPPRHPRPPRRLVRPRRADHAVLRGLHGDHRDRPGGHAAGRAAQARPGQRLRFRPHPAPDLREERP